MVADSPQPRITNADLALMIGDMRGQLSSIKQITDRLDHAINGNTKPGLIDGQRDLSVKLDKVNNKLCDHIEEHLVAKKQTSDKKEKWGTRTWAIFLIFLTQTISLIFLFIQTGLFG